MEAVDGVEEEEGADPLVEVLAAPAEGIQFVALLEQLVQW